MNTKAVEGTAPLASLKERRHRYRLETVDAILAVARMLIREEGVAALNLNEVARRLGVSGQALAKYFPNKAAVYDALFVMGGRLFREAEEEVWRTTEPDWWRVRQWFDVRMALACENPDLYHLIWDRPVPGFMPSESGREEMAKMLAGARRGIGEVIKAGNIDAGIPDERVVDILLSVRRGIIAEHLGKREMLPLDPDRFHDLIHETLAVFEQAWSPGRGKDTA